MLAAVHPIEISLLCGSIMAVIGWTFLVYLKIRDIWLNKANGPIHFMLNDNRRRGMWMLTLSIIAVRIAFIAIQYPPTREDYAVMHQSLESMWWMNIISYGLVVEAFFTYRRREKMAYLVTKYGGMVGGQRHYDPPPPPSKGDY